MVHTVKKSNKKALRPEDYFEFTLESDTKKEKTVYRLPLLKFLKPGVALRMTAGDPSGMVRLFDQYAPAALDALEDDEELDDLFAGWKAASGIDLGESSASAAS